jgi:hypothetical protein
MHLVDALGGSAIRSRSLTASCKPAGLRSFTRTATEPISSPEQLRLTGRARGVRIISTCHGWVESMPALRLYNAIDRWSTVPSDVTAVPDSRMLASFPPIGWRTHVPNGVPELPAVTDVGAGLDRAGAGHPHRRYLELYCAGRKT